MSGLVDAPSPVGVPASPALLLFSALLLAGCSDSTGPDDPGGPGPGPGGGSGSSARVVITPGALLLTAAGETMQLTATVLDAAGQPVQTNVTWHSSDPAAVHVSSDGLATASGGLGSAQITAVAQGVTSVPALALVASTVAGVVSVPDSLILTDPVAIVPAAVYGPGWQYRIKVRGVNLAAGQLVVGTGGRSLAGRVVAASAQGAETELTVELVPLHQLFADLQINETIPLVEMAMGTGGSNLRAPTTPGVGTATDFTLGRFKCSASGSVPSLDLPNPTLNIQPRLSLALGYANGLEKYAVVGRVTADFGYKPVFKAVFEGKATCETVLKTVTLPIGGVIAWFFGIQVPLGVGFELDGKLEIAEVGFDVSAHAEATAELGLLCPAAGGTCTGITSFEIPQPDFDFEFIAPDPSEQFKVALGAKAFIFARPSVGTSFSASTQFAFLEATAGVKQSIDLATATRQVEETDYASGFALESLIDVGPGTDLTAAIEKLEKLLGTDLDPDLTLVAIADTVAESPKGTFTITPAAVAPGNDAGLGEMATFTVDLDPITYLGIQSVEKVEIFWRKDDGNGGFTLEPGRPGCTDILASPGQTTFTCQTDFLEEHAGEQTFYAFVHAKMFGVPLPIPLEVASDGVANLAVGGQCPANPLVAELLEEIGASDGDGGGSWETEVIAKDWGNLEAFATSTAPVPPPGGHGFIGPGVTVELGFFDELSFVPLDPERVGELAVLVLDVSGFIEVSGAGNAEDIDVHTFVRFYSGYDDVDISHRASEDGLGMFPFSQQATLPVHLGQWANFDGYLVVNVGPGEDASTSTSSARLRIDRLVEVRDLQGNVIPIAQVCTSSGHEYPT